jgi:hypothetical protein
MSSGRKYFKLIIVIIKIFPEITQNWTVRTLTGFLHDPHTFTLP